MEYVSFGELYSKPSCNGLSRPSAVRGEGYKMVNMGELFSNDIINDIPMERVQLSLKEKEKFLLEKGDLLFARQSLVASGAGKCSIINELKEETTFESHLIKVSLDQSKVNPWYYYYLFQLSYNPIKSIVNQCAQAGIRGKELAKIKVQKPKISEQVKVVNILKSYDLSIENNNKRIKILEQMAEELYKEWFARKRVNNQNNDLCTYHKIKDIFKFIRGISYSSEEIACKDGMDLVNLKNINSFGGFRRDGYKKYNGKFKKEQVVKRYDLIMGITDMTQDRRTVGSVALIPTVKSESVISADLVLIKSEINNIYLYCLFRFGGISKYISQFANGANVLHLRPDMIKNVQIPIANKEVIELFVKNVKPVFDEIEKLNLQNDNLIKQRDLLLPRLMSGKLEVK